MFWCVDGPSDKDMQMEESQIRVFAKRLHCRGKLQKGKQYLIMGKDGLTTDTNGRWVQSRCQVFLTCIRHSLSMFFSLFSVYFCFWLCVLLAYLFVSLSFNISSLLTHRMQYLLESTNWIEQIPSRCGATLTQGYCANFHNFVSEYRLSGCTQ